MNGKMSEILGTAEHLYPHKLEAAYPRILEKITETWDSPSVREYFDELLLDRRGDRQGFHGDILTEIFALRNHYYSLQPTPPVTINTWADAVDLERLDKRAKEGGQEG